jgi:acyl carrier protein
MNSKEILPQIADIMRDLLDDEAIELTPKTTAADVKGWDSVLHINLIVGIEQRFKIKFKTAELEELKDLRHLVHLIEEKRR